MKNHSEVKTNFNYNTNGLTKLVLVGNPNVGKSVFFNSLTNLYVDVSNFPGTTVDISSGKFENYLVLDTPGVYGVSSFNDEEKVARDIIINADIILNVVDATNLQRDLFLTQQLIDMGKKVIIALNMMDEVKKKGLKIDVDELSNQLGVPVILTIASKNYGIDKIKRELTKASEGKSINDIKQLLIPYLNKNILKAEAVLILEDDPIISKRNNEKITNMRDYIYRKRRDHIDKIVDKILLETNKGASINTIIGRLMLKPITGIPMLIIVLLATFLFIGVFIGQIIIKITEIEIMTNWFAPIIISLFEKIISRQSFVGSIIIGEFGIFTMAPIYVIGLLLPLIIGFYLVLSIFEDSGYLPRIAVLSDKFLTGIGLNGRAIIPIILAFGCFTVAAMTTRLLGSKRERIIATALLGLTIPCSAQMGVVVGKLASLGLLYSIFYFVILILIFGVVGKILNKLLPQQSMSLLLDLPPIRIPKIKNIYKKTYIKSKMFLLEATPLFVLGALLISILKYFGILDQIQQLIAPITVWWLRLPKETANIFIMGIVRRDFGTAGLNNLILSNQQLFVALITLTLFVPCIASIMVIFKERTKIEALSIWFGSMITAFFIGGIITRVLDFF